MSTEVAASLPELALPDLIARIVLSAVLGGVVGLERELRDQPAGFRTHMLVSLGSALFTMVGAYGAEAFFSGRPAPVSLDPTRVAAQVVTGIGFLGAGAIIRQGFNIRGLTTAAALWVTAAIGVAVGLGFWVGAAAAALMTVITLYAMKRLERGLIGRLGRRRAELSVDLGAEASIAGVVEAIERVGGRISSVSVRRGEGGERRLVVSVPELGGTLREAIVEAAAHLEGVMGVEFTGDRS